MPSRALSTETPSEFTPAFFRRDTLSVARALLGAELSTTIDGETTSGIIVEVEAYGALPDPASHGFRGETERNRVLFWSGGHCYVYLIYGMHYCVNVSTETKGKGCGVLLRALEPVTGLETMRQRRGVSRDALLTNGPGRLCRALGIDRAMSGENYLTSSKIRLRPALGIEDSRVVRTTRIGISVAKDLPWRLYVRGNPFVSKK